MKLPTTIETRYEQVSAELERAPKWVRSPPADLGLLSLHQPAYAAGASPTTMPRLARGFRFESFEAMRHLIIGTIAKSINTNLQSPQGPTTSGDQSAVDALNKFQVDNQTSIFHRNSVEAYAAASETSINS